MNTLLKSRTLTGISEALDAWYAAYAKVVDIQQHNVELCQQVEEFQSAIDAIAPDSPSRPILVDPLRELRQSHEHGKLTEGKLECELKNAAYNLYALIAETRTDEFAGDFDDERSEAEVEQDEADAKAELKAATEEGADDDIDPLTRSAKEL